MDNNVLSSCWFKLKGHKVQMLGMVVRIDYDISVDLIINFSGILHWITLKISESGMKDIGPLDHIFSGLRLEFLPNHLQASCWTYGCSKQCIICLAMAKINVA